MYNIASSVKKHRLYGDFLKVKSKLAAHQFVCWLAGGAVRDFFLEREVTEFDLVTDATTEVLKAIFPEALLVGQSFGVLKIPLPDNEFFDLATFRQESDYKDGRRPSHVEASTPVKDTLRRDFTINAMFWDDVQNRIIDYRGGLFDLKNKRIICVSEPEIRFTEDYLRIIRLVRFAAVLKFEIESQTRLAALKYKSKINQVSGERIWSELLKISRAAAWEYALKQDLFLALLEEIFETKEININHNVKNTTHIFISVYLINPALDFSTILKKKLKVSNQELAVYNSIRFIMSSVAKLSVDKLSVEELAFEIEKKIAHENQIKALVDIGLISEDLKKRLKDILHYHRQPLVLAKDLIGLIPDKCISEELKYLRISQFNRTYKSKAEALDYLKKKYADKVKKP